MVALIVLFAMFGVALAAGWVAQLLVGKRPIDWTQAGCVGLVGTAIAGGIAWLFDRHVATVFSVTGLVLAILVSFVIEWLVVRREVAERREEHHREHELTPEGLPGHHQPKKRKKKRR
jgi:phosphotransferase system  glucose/maltose/N-acetylglucosamine-specific IIC component